MNNDERVLESLKLLRECSSWMVGVQTAIFGLLVTLLNANKIQLGSFYIKGSVIAFSLSIIFSGLVLTSIPWLLNRTPLTLNVYKMVIFNRKVLDRLSIGLISALQYMCFVVGLMCLALSILFKQIG